SPAVATLGRTRLLPRRQRVRRKQLAALRPALSSRLFLTPPGVLRRLGFLAPLAACLAVVARWRHRAVQRIQAQLGPQLLVLGAEPLGFRSDALQLASQLPVLALE